MFDVRKLKVGEVEQVPPPAVPADLHQVGNSLDRPTLERAQQRHVEHADECVNSGQSLKTNFFTIGKKNESVDLENVNKLSLSAGLNFNLFKKDC